MTDNINHGLTIEFARVAKLKLPECETCKGVDHIYGCSTCDNLNCDCQTAQMRKPCPTCAPLRKLAEICWHDSTHFDDGPLKGQIKDCDCGLFGKQTRLGRDHSNPTYTIESAVQMMKDLGEWKEFGVYLWLKSSTKYNFYKTADILTNRALLLPAMVAYLRGIK